ncbi:hypothetical protein [Cytobacillus firmus]|uniref:hypothetical protein n=1 Tax=Cytobacillus firmus TaxID=1399 RepID=UPI001C8E509B|nr:hypothetical protein [Cytobacillus firmus]MBX9976484.1 hypothetical protein [Cytobacillus firmus]
MWILTLFLHDKVRMFEYDNKDDARTEFEKANGCKILSEIIHYRDFEKEEVKIPGANEAES